jgi:F-type H+-transporting ATPase subunit delta
MSKVSRRTLAASIAELMENNQPDLAKGLAAYLVQEGRAKELESLLRDVARLRYEQQGVLEIDATTAHALNAEIQAEIKRMLPAKEHIVHETREPGIIGGLLLETADRQLDLTVRHRLSQLKQGVI